MRVEPAAQGSSVACVVCGHATLRPLHSGLMRCDECGMVTAQIAEDVQELPNLYGDRFFCGNEYADYIGDKRHIQRNFRQRLRTVLQYVPSGRLVEMGCAHGFFLELAQQHFEVRGYDVSREAVEYATRVLDVPAVCGDFLSDDALAPGSVDVVTMWDVIEHVPEPRRFVQRSADVLRERGHLLLTTGDMDSWLARRQGPKWRLICPPTHLQYFSATTIRRLLADEGFEVLRILYPGYWRSVKQILHGLFVFGRRGRSRLVHRVLSWLLPPNLGIYLNTFDIMCVVAQKSS